MAETETEVLDTEDAGTEVDTELDAATVVGDITASEQAGVSDGTADTVIEDEGFTPTAQQIELAKQLGYSADEIAAMDEVEASVVDKLARLDSRRQQRKGKEARPKEAVVDAESSTDDDIDAEDSDDEFTEDDWFTDEGRAKINRILKAAKAGSQTQQNTDKQRLKAEADKVFDALDPHIFESFLPGESDLIEPGSPADARRSQAFEMAKTIQATAKSLGHDLTLAKAIDQSLSIIAPTETENAALNKANAGRQKRGRQRISSPSSVTGKQKFRYDTPEEQAAADTIAELNTG